MGPSAQKITKKSVSGAKQVRSFVNYELSDVADNLIEECLDMAVTGSERLSSTGSVWSQPRPIRRMKSLNSSTQIGPKDSVVITPPSNATRNLFPRELSRAWRDYRRRTLHGFVPME